MPLDILEVVRDELKTSRLLEGMIVESVERADDEKWKRRMTTALNRCRRNIVQLETIRAGLEARSSAG